jgi:hypothetical protein
MNIWIPKLAVAETKDPISVRGARMEGLFKLVGTLPDGRSRVICDWFPNLITDGGLERHATASIFDYCSVGSGTTTPTNADTALASFVATSNTLTFEAIASQPNPPYYAYTRAKYRFNPPGTNRNIGEVGVGWANNGTSLWSRSLLKDINGDPTVASWLAQETLDVYYEVRKYPWLTDVTSQVVIAGVTHDLLMRCALVNAHDGGTNGPSWSVYGNKQYIFKPNSWQGGSFWTNVYSGDIGPITGAPAGTLVTPATQTPNAYVANSKKLTGTVVMGSTQVITGNAVRSIKVHDTIGPYQIQFTPAVSKLVDWALTLNFETGFWGRKP